LVRAAMSEPSSKKQRSGSIGSPPPVDKRGAWAWKFFTDDPPAEPGQDYKLVCQVESMLKDGTKVTCRQRMKWAGSAGNLTNHLNHTHSIFEAGKEPDVGAAPNRLDQWFKLEKTVMEAAVSYVIQDLQPLSADRNADPLKVWADLEASGEFPILAKLAKIYLAIPASNASVERLFSAAGNVYSEKRGGLDPETAIAIVFLYANKHHFWPKDDPD